jgi:hypothetical protein
MVDEDTTTPKEIYEKIWEIYHGLGNVRNFLYLFDDLILVILRDCTDKKKEADLLQLRKIHERVLNDLDLINEKVSNILRVQFPEIDNLHQD